MAKLSPEERQRLIAKIKRSRAAKQPNNKRMVDVDSLRAQTQNGTPLSKDQRSKLIAKIKDSRASEAPVESEVMSLGMNVLDKAGRVLDYAGGLTRGAVSEGIDAFVPGDVYTGEDWKKALVGKGPTSSEVLEKFGVGEMGNAGPITGRGAAGFALDIASDPLTYASLGTLPLAKYGAKALRAAGGKIGKGVKSASKNYYQFGLRNLDEVANKTNLEKQIFDDFVPKKAPSEIAFEKGIVGGNESVYKQLADTAQSNVVQRNKILSELGESTADINKALMEPTRSFRSMAKEADTVFAPENAAAAKQAKDMIGGIRRKLGKNPTINQLESQKRILGDSLKDASSQLRLNTNEKLLKNSARKGLREESVNALNKARVGAGDDFSRLGYETESILSGLPKQLREVIKEGRKTPITQVKGALAGSGSKSGLGGLIGMVGSKVLNNPGFVTRVGQKGYKVGNYLEKGPGLSNLVEMVPESVYQRMLINSTVDRDQ